MQGIELFVVGDSHTNFWNGSGNQGASDCIPGVRSLTIPGATAYSLLSETSVTQARIVALQAIRDAVAQGLRGWLMLSFGANDCNGWIWRQVPRLTLGDAISEVVDRYITFINEVREIYPKVAIFGPPATTDSPLHLANVGTEAERNAAVLIFTGMLIERLWPLAIPVVSMAEAMIGRDGHADTHLYCDDKWHPAQIMMPYALQLTNAALGLHLKIADDPLVMKESRIRNFSAVDPCEMFDMQWLRFMLPEGGQYIAEIGIWPDTFRSLQRIDIATSLDMTYEMRSWHFSEDGSPATQKRYFRLDLYARHLLFASPARLITEHDIEIYKCGSQISNYIPYFRESLFAIRDSVLQQSRYIPTIKGMSDARISERV